MAAPAAISRYSDQLVTNAPMPSSRCELSSLMTAAMNPHEIPVAAPSTAARARRARTMAQPEGHGQGQERDAGDDQARHQP